MKSLLVNATILCAVVIVAACAKKKEFSQGYQIVSYDHVSGRYVILSKFLSGNNRYATNRITVVCSWSQYGKNDVTRGQDACDLSVGAMYVPDWVRFLYAKEKKPLDDQDHYDAFESGRDLMITSGVGDRKQTNDLTILDERVISDVPTT